MAVSKDLYATFLNQRTEVCQVVGLEEGETETGKEIHREFPEEKKDFNN